MSDLFLRYQKYDNWQLYEGVVQTLFKGGPNAVDREFKTYEEVVQTLFKGGPNAVDREFKTYEEV